MNESPQYIEKVIINMLRDNTKVIKIGDRVIGGGNPMGIFSKLFGSYSTRELARIEPIKQKVLALDEEYTALSDAELKGKTRWF